MLPQVTRLIEKNWPKYKDDFASRLHLIAREKLVGEGHSYLAGGHVWDAAMSLDGLELVQAPVQLLQGFRGSSHIVLIYKTPDFVRPVLN